MTPNPPQLEILLADSNALSAWFAARMRPRATTDSKPQRSVIVEDRIISMMMGAGYQIVGDKIALIPVIGPMFKGYGSWGYADQTEIRAAVRAAAQDPNVSGIMLLIDSPGGSVAGTPDLADEIKAADKVKPVYAYIEDLGCSAAYWVAASARQIFCNNTAFVGSIGVITALVDASKMYEQAGIKVHPIVTGKFKAVGDESQPVTVEALAYIQERIDGIFALFAAGVAKGRGMNVEKVKALEAGVFLAEHAVEKKLVDQVASFEKAFSALAKEAKSSGSTSSAGKRARAMMDAIAPMK